MKIGVHLHRIKMNQPLKPKDPLVAVAGVKATYVTVNTLTFWLR